MVEVQNILLKVIGAWQNPNVTEEIHFHLKCYIKLMDLYSNRVGGPLQSLRFLYDGVRVNSNDTPALLDMEECDLSEVLPEMVGLLCIDLT